MKSKIFKLTAYFIFLFLSGCAWFKPYQHPVQQGNIIKPAAVNRLKKGMSKSSVTQLIGDPVLINTFSNNRFNYIYYFKHDDQAQTNKVILTFKSGRLSKIQKED